MFSNPQTMKGRDYDMGDRSNRDIRRSDGSLALSDRKANDGQPVMSKSVMKRIAIQKAGRAKALTKAIIPDGLSFTVRRPVEHCPQSIACNVESDPCEDYMNGTHWGSEVYRSFCSLQQKTMTTWAVIVWDSGEIQEMFGCNDIDEAIPEITRYLQDQGYSEMPRIDVYKREFHVG